MNTLSYKDVVDPENNIWLTYNFWRTNSAWRSFSRNDSLQDSNKLVRAWESDGGEHVFLKMSIGN